MGANTKHLWYICQMSSHVDPRPIDVVDMWSALNLRLQYAYQTWRLRIKTSSSRYRGKHWDRAKGISPHLHSQPSPQSPWPKQERSRSRWRPWAVVKLSSRHDSSPLNQIQSSANTARRSTLFSPSVSGQRSTTSSPSTLAVLPVSP
jgi:hypothetical protein